MGAYGRCGGWWVGIPEILGTSRMGQIRAFGVIWGVRGWKSRRKTPLMGWYGFEGWVMGWVADGNTPQMGAVGYYHFASAPIRAISTKWGWNRVGAIHGWVGARNRDANRDCRHYACNGTCGRSRGDGRRCCNGRIRGS